ncbi:hypothetical protein Tco_0610766 [Tanacetum coccineum]
MSKEVGTPRYLSLVVPLKKVGDEDVHKELGDRMERVATTASSLEAKQDSGSGPRCQDTILGDVDAQTRFETISKQSNDPPLSRGYTLRSGKNSMKLLELMELCTKLSNMLHKNRNSDLCKKKVILTESSIRSDLHLEDARGTDCLPTTTIFEELARMGKDTAVTQEETQQDDRVPTPSNDPPLSGLQRLRKVGESKRVESSKDKESLGDHEDASKQGRSYERTLIRGDISLVDVPWETLIQIKVAKPKVVTTAATTTTTTRPKARGVVVQEPSEFRTPQESQPSITKDKGKAIMIEHEVPLKRKDQVALDEDLARNLQAQLEAKLIEEERLARKKEEEANIALIESWDNTQAMMEADFECSSEGYKKNKERYLKQKEILEESSKGTEDELECDKSKKAEGSEEKAKGSRKKMLGKKRAGKEQPQESSNIQRIEDDKETDEHEEVEVDDDVGA